MRKITNRARWLPAWTILLFAFAGVASFAGPNEDILAASKVGDRAGVEAALASGASVNAVGMTPEGVSAATAISLGAGLSPLGLAAVYGHKNVAVLLLAQGARVDATDSIDQTPLHKAAVSGSTDVAKLLLDHGAKVNARDIFGATPLSYSAIGGHKNVAALLLARGALVNAQTRADETTVRPAAETPLHLAAASGHKEMVALLLARGADVNARNGEGQTPLEEMQAASLDAATKTSITTLLQTKPKVQAASPTQVQTASPAPVQAPAPSVASTQPIMPTCWDVPGIARVISQANPGIDPAVLALAVEKAQVMMGCRPAPQTTKCSWIGPTWTCKTQ